MLKNGYSAPIIFHVSQDFGVGDVNGAIDFVLLSNVKVNNYDLIYIFSLSEARQVACHRYILSV